MTPAKPLHSMVCEVCNARHDHSVTRYDGMTSAKPLPGMMCEVCNVRYDHSMTMYDGLIA